FPRGRIKRACVLTCLRAAIIILTAGLVALGITRLLPWMAPVQKGSEEAFWEAAFRWDPQERVLGYGEAYGLRNGWYVYEATHMHGSDLCRVAETEVNAQFEEALRRLERWVTTDAAREYVKEGYRRWRDNPAGRQHDLPALLAQIDE